MIAEVQLPLEDTEIDERHYDEETQEAGGYGSISGNFSIISICLFLEQLLPKDVIWTV